MPVATRWPLVGRRDQLEAFTLALSDAGCEAFCIYGPSGVGKTRLADECAALAEAAGRRVSRATADRSADAVPLGAIAHLLPAHSLAELGEGDVNDAIVRAKLLDAARQALGDLAPDEGRPVLLLDDAHRLDGPSLAVVDQLVATRALFALATVVTGEAVPETVTRWWRDERGARLDLEHLDAVGVDTLLHVVLQGPLDAGASVDLWEASGGNLLALRELVLGATARDALVLRDGVWYLAGPLAASTRVRELVEARISGLDEAARSALELLALCQPVGLGQLEARFGLTTLEALERDGLIAVRTDGRRESVSLNHPLHGEVLRAGIPALRSRAILLGQAEAVEIWGARRREDPLRIATWRLAATGRADPDLLLRAARLARYTRDFRQAANLARAALASQPSASAGLVLGESLYDLAAYEEAERVLAEALERATGDDELVRIATVRRRNLFWGCRRDDEALAVARSVESRLPAGPARDELIIGDAEVMAFSGRPLDALALLEHVDLTVPRIGVLAAIPFAAALAIAGRTVRAVEVSEQGYRDHLALGDELAIASPETHVVTQVFALVEAGRLAEAEELGRRSLDVATRSRMHRGVAWFCVHLARGALAQGRPVTARGWAERATSTAHAWGLRGLQPIACSILAVAYALLGDADASSARREQADALASSFGFLVPELALGRAWALVAAREIQAARAELLAGARTAEEMSNVPAAAWLLHDAVRLGAVNEAAPRLRALAPKTDSVLVAARAEHAEALLARDALRLEAAVESFEAIGARLLAAEAAADAADARRSTQDQRRATVLDVRSNDLAARCEGAMTPRLVRITAVVPLTAREREVALLAAAGQSSRAIAERLYLSVRTVDNHLSRIYDKLGVSSRTALSAVLGRERA
jgi:ATP/maltotriose-dependent transcriptional regulator MalT